MAGEKKPEAKPVFSYEEVQKQALEMEDFKDRLLKMRKEPVAPVNYAEKQLVIHTFSLEKKDRYKINSEKRFLFRQAWNAEMAKWEESARRGALATIISIYEGEDALYVEQERDSLQVIELFSAFIAKITRAYDDAIRFPEKISKELMQSINSFETKLGNMLKEVREVKVKIAPPKAVPEAKDGNP